jgi:predicted outer membrane repeat protein
MIIAGDFSICDNLSNLIFAGNEVSYLGGAIYVENYPKIENGVNISCEK